MKEKDQRTLQITALVVAGLSSFLAPFMGASVNIALPAIGRELSINAVLAGWVSTAYLLAAATFLVPLGKVADMVGRKRVFTYGVSIYTFCSLLAALADTPALLIGARVLQGIGSAMVFGTGVAILTSVFPAAERGRALGINVAATYTGLSLGPFLGGLLTQQLGWRSIFLVNLPLGLVILTLVTWRLKGEWIGGREQTFDWVGSIVYGLALVATMYGLSVLPQTAGLWLLFLGGTGLGAFVWWETRTRSPILDMDLFLHNAGFAFSNLAALIHYCATFASSFLMSYYLQYVKGLNAQQAGLVLIAQPVMMAVFSPLAGRLSDRIEPRVVASLGMAITAGALVLLAFVTGTTTLALVVGYQGLLGLGFALFSSPNTNAVMSSVHQRQYGVASATVGTMRLTGQMLSMGLAMLMLTLFVGGTDITPSQSGAFLSGMKVAFITYAVLCCGGIFASLARGRISTPAGSA
jgi:EmrB/QacA subfamily drug resistance transporter